MGRTVAALDFGASGVRGVQFSLSKKTPRVEKIGYVPLPRGVIEAGVIRDPAAVTAALTALWKNGKFTTKQVIFSVANADMVVRQMDLPWQPPAEFRQALPDEVARALGQPVDEFNLDYHLLDDQIAGPDGREARILLVAANAEMVDAFVQAIRNAGLFPTVADLAPFALIQAAQGGDATPGTAEAIVDIGADVTTIVVAQAGQPRFVRILPGQGGNAITKALMSAFDWNFDDAEGTKRALGVSTQIAMPQITDTVFGGDAPAPSAPAEEHPAQRVITEVASGAIREIRTSLDYFLASAEDVRSYSRLVLSGGGSLLRGLAPRLASELRLPVEYVTPLQAVNVKAKVTVPEGIIEQQLSVPVGLALGVAR